MADYENAPDLDLVDAPEVDSAPSLRDELSANLKAIQEAPVEEAPAVDRDEAGKFKAKDAAEPEAVAAPEAVEAPAEPEPAPEITAAPASWRSEAKAKWADTPAEVRAEIERRETEVRQLAGRMDGERQAGRVFTEVITPYLPIIRQQNMDPAQIIGDLLQTSYVLNTGDATKKAQTLALIADQYGIDMDQAYQFRGRGQLAPQFQPQAAAPVDINAQIENAIAQREVAREIEAFENDPKNVHYATVKPHMEALLSAGLAETLQDAYDQAIYARPDLRSTLIAAQVNSREAQQAAERAQRAAQARSAAVSPSGSTGSPRPANPAETSLRDELRDRYRALAGAV